jgi:hypothetical protein
MKQVHDEFEAVACAALVANECSVAVFVVKAEAVFSAATWAGLVFVFQAA